jgi:hypothetical protein
VRGATKHEHQEKIASESFKQAITYSMSPPTFEQLSAIYETKHAPDTCILNSIRRLQCVRSFNSLAVFRYNFDLGDHNAYVVWMRHSGFVCINHTEKGKHLIRNIVIKTRRSVY